MTILSVEIISHTRGAPCIQVNAVYYHTYYTHTHARARVWYKDVYFIIICVWVLIEFVCARSRNSCLLLFPSVHLKAYILDVCPLCRSARVSLIAFAARKQRISRRDAHSERIRDDIFNRIISVALTFHD